MEYSNNSLSDDDIYDLFLLFQGLDEMKRSILMVLLHIYPKEVSATQIASLSGYSSTSKYIFKSGALEMLEKENLILISRPAKRLSIIKINPEHELLLKFSALCQRKGKDLQELLLGKILENE